MKTYTEEEIAAYIKTALLKEFGTLRAACKSIGVSVNDLSNAMGQQKSGTGDTPRRYPKKILAHLGITAVKSINYSYEIGGYYENGYRREM